MAFTVKTVADIAGISVRTLHHYDRIWLLKPADLSPAGYRHYSNTDLAKLQQILFYKELGFKLLEIKNILADPDYNIRVSLLDQRKLLQKKRQRLDDLVELIDKTIEAAAGGLAMSNKEIFAAFDQSKIEEYKKEVQEKYDKATVDESEARTGKYTKANWKEIKAESDEINQGIAALMSKGPADSQVQELVGQFHKHINDRFYTCTPEIFRGLGELYVSDARFKAFYEKIKPGLAEFMREAMAIFCDHIA